MRNGNLECPRYVPHSVDTAKQGVDVTTPGKRVLLTTQRNFLFSGLQGKGFSPSDFDLTEIPEQRIAELTHRSTRYYFNLTVGHTGAFDVGLSPGKELLHEKRPAANWSDVAHYFGYWIANLLREVEAPDFWSAVAGDTQLVTDAAGQASDNRIFTSDELSQVRKALNEIKAYLVKSHQFSEAQTELIEGKFEYLEESATRLGRKDWTNIGISTLLGIATSLALSNDGTRDLFRFAGQIFRQILGGMLYLSGPH